MYSLISGTACSSVPLLRMSGAVASGLICLHSLSLLFTSGGKPSFLRSLHNLADIVMFFGFGFAGIVAELFPRDSVTYRILKSNFAFLNNLVGRGIFYFILGCVVMGDFGVTKSMRVKTLDEQDDDDSPRSFFDYVTVASGMYIAIVGIGLVYTAIRNRNRRSLQTAELTQPIVAFVPTVPAGVVERNPQVTHVSEEIQPEVVNFPTPV